MTTIHADAPPQGPNESSAIAPPRTILAIDDNQDNLFVLGELLESSLPDCRLVTSQDPHAALELARKFRPAGALLDVHMPGLSGIDVCKILRADTQTQHIPVLLLTAMDAAPELLASGLEAGAIDFIAKPINNLELVARVRVMLRIGEAEASLRRSRDALSQRVDEVSTAFQSMAVLHRAAFSGMRLGFVLGEVLWEHGEPADLRLIDVNPAFERMVGVRREQLLDRRAGEVLSEPSMLLAARYLEIAGSRDFLNERRLIASLDRHIAITAFVPVSGQLAITLEDVTERVEMQAALMRSERLASIGLIAAAVAHEINNPLTYVLGNLESLAKRLPPDDEPAAWVAETLDGARRIERIVRDLRTFSREEGHEPTTSLNLADLVERAAEFCGSQLSACRVRLVLDEVPPIVANEGRLVQVLVNLLVNAAQAVGPKGGRVTVRLYARNSAVFVDVEDDGPGFRAEVLPRIFDPLYTTKDNGQGTGLGLSISRNILESIGGTITAENAEDGGARLQIRLPAAAAAAPVEAPEIRTSAPTATARLLIVDDEPHVTGVLGRILKIHEVHTRCSGSAAQELIAKDPAFDAILCDLIMPLGSGIELYDWLEERDPGLASRMIFMTGGAFTPAAAQFASRMAGRVLTKPIRHDLLLQALAKVLSERMQ